MKFEVIRQEPPSARWVNWHVELHVFVGLLAIYACSWAERLSSSCAKV